MQYADFQRLQEVFRGASGITKVSCNSRGNELNIIKDLIYAANEGAQIKVCVYDGVCGVEVMKNGVAEYPWSTYTGFQYQGKSCRVELTEGHGLFFNKDMRAPYGQGEPCLDYTDARHKIGAWLKENAPEFLQSLQEASDRELSDSRVYGWRP